MSRPIAVSIKAWNYTLPPTHSFKISTREPRNSKDQDHDLVQGHMWQPALGTDPLPARCGLTWTIRFACVEREGIGSARLSRLMV